MQRSFTAAPHIPPVDERHRNPHPVRRDRLDPLRRIQRAVEPAGDFLLFSELRSSGPHVVVEHRRGRDQRLVAVAQQVGGPLAVAAQVHAVRGLGKADLRFPRNLRPGTRKVQHAQVLQPAAPLGGDREPGEQRHVFQHHVLAVPDQLRPLRRGHYGRGDQPEIASPVVDADVQEPVAVVGIIFDVLAPRHQQPGLCIRFRSPQQTRFAGSVASALDHDILAVARAARAQIEPFVGLFQHQHVVRHRRPQPMPVQLELPLLHLILDRIKQCPVVGRPHDRPHAFPRFRQELACPQVLDMQRVLPEACGVGRIGQQAAVVGDVHAAQGHKVVPRRERFHIEDHLLRRSRKRFPRAALAAVHRVLRALGGARVVPVLAFARGHAYVGLLDVRQQFAV